MGKAIWTIIIISVSFFAGMHSHTFADYITFVGAFIIASFIISAIGKIWDVPTRSAEAVRSQKHK